MVSKYPREFICRCIKERKVLWTYHVNMRLESRLITRDMIISSLLSLEIIEEYPEDKYLPSYLLFAQHTNVMFHILIAIDVSNDNIRIITAYIPNRNKWKNDFKTRRKGL